MIVSHRHKFIFLKTHKTGGTSIEVALAKVCGPDDIVTPISAADEKLRAGSPARNYKLGLAKLGLPIGGDLRTRFPRLGGYYNHMPARQARALLGPDIWNGYFKFSIERNPWDRQVSYYFWQTRNEKPKPDFRTYMQREIQLENWPVYAIDGSVAVDRVIEYDRIDGDLAEIGEQLGIEEEIVLPRAKGHTRVDDRHYRDFYDDTTRAVIEKRYAREIAAFGYTF